MSTHNTVTKADHMACFRCKEKHENFRIMFEVVQVQCSIRELANETHTSPQDLLKLNSAEDDLVSARLFLFLFVSVFIPCNVRQEITFREMTTERKTVMRLPENWDLNTPLSGRSVRVFRAFSLLNHRPENSLATGFSDLQMVSCETHALMRISESLLQALLPNVFHEKTAEMLNAALSKVDIR